MNNKFKKIIFLSTLLFVLAVVVPSVRADAMSDLNNLKFKAANDCASLNASLAQWKSDFTAATSDKYKFIEAPVVSGALINLPALSAAMLGIANTVIGTAASGLTKWCTDMQTFTLPAQLDAAKARYAELKSVLKIREVIIPLFQAVAEVNNFYGKAKKLVDDRDYLNTVNTTAIFTQYTVVGGLAAREGTALGQIITSVGATLTAINAPANMPAVAFYSAIPGKTEALAKADIASIRSKLGIYSDRISSSNTLARSGRDFAGTIINFAAQNGDVPVPAAPVELKDTYQKLLDTYNGRAQSLCENLQNVITREIANLDSMANGITAGDLNNLSAAVGGPIVTIQNRINTVKINLNTILATLPVGCAIDFKTVVDGMSAVKALNIDIALKPIYQIAKGFNRSYGKANELKVNFTDVFNATRDAIDAGLPGGLPAAGVQDPNFLVLNNAINNAATGVLPIQLTPLLAQKASIEANIVGAIANPVQLGVLKNSVNTFSSRLSATSSEISKLRTEWWKFIKQYAINSTTPLPVALANEQRAAKLFDDFQTKKASLKNAAQRIVDSRNLVLDKYQFTVDGLQNIPTAAPDVRGAVGFAARTAALKADLAAKLTAINNAKNYDDIKTKLNEIKDLGLARVYFPSMRMYIRFDEYYKKLAILQTSIMPVFDAKINILETGNPNQILASGSLRSTYTAVNTLLGTLKTDFDSTLMTEMVNALNTPADSTLFATLNGKETIARNNLTSIIAQLRQLSSSIVVAEKLK